MCKSVYYIQMTQHWRILLCVVMNFRILCEEGNFTEQLRNWYLLNKITALKDYHSNRYCPYNAEYRYISIHLIWSNLNQSVPHDLFHVIRIDSAGNVTLPRLNIRPSVKFVQVNPEKKESFHSFSSRHNSFVIETGHELGTTEDSRFGYRKV